DRNVAIQLGLVECPDDFLRRLGNRGICGEEPLIGLRLGGNFLQLGVDIGIGRRSDLVGRHGWSSARLGLGLGPAALGGGRASWSSFASRSSRRIAMLVRRSARRVMSARMGRLRLASACVMADSITLRNGADPASQ